jgi:hypothetical protein
MEQVHTLVLDAGPSGRQTDHNAVHSTALRRTGAEAILSGNRDDFDCRANPAVFVTG